MRSEEKEGVVSSEVWNKEGVVKSSVKEGVVRPEVVRSRVKEGVA